MLRKSPFIIPSAPLLAKTPPIGREWLHEVKHDGWRAHLHKAAVLQRNHSEKRDGEIP